MRIFDLVDNQVRSLRKRQLINSYLAPSNSVDHRLGAYWSIRSHMADFARPGLPADPKRTDELAALPTRLAAVDTATQERVINWGYAVCDAAIRTHVTSELPMGSFPYAGGV